MRDDPGRTLAVDEHGRKRLTAVGVTRHDSQTREAVAPECGTDRRATPCGGLAAQHGVSWIAEHVGVDVMVTLPVLRAPGQSDSAVRRGVVRRVLLIGALCVNVS